MNVSQAETRPDKMNILCPQKSDCEYVKKLIQLVVILELSTFLGSLRAEGEVGRFQLCVGKIETLSDRPKTERTIIIKIDTATGQTWQLSEVAVPPTLTGAPVNSLLTGWISIATDLLRTMTQLYAAKNITNSPSSIQTSVVGMGVNNYPIIDVKE